MSQSLKKVFIIEDSSEKKLGEIIFFPQEKEFKINIDFLPEKEKIERLLNGFLENGIKNLGNVVLIKPVKSDHPLFLTAVENFLARMGYTAVLEKVENEIKT